jgi:uncharacterized protein YaaN involved in tellurite resistance
MTVVTKPILSSEKSVIQDLQLTDVVDITQINPELEAKADKFLEAILDPKTESSLRNASIDQMGSGVARRIVNKSEMLKDPINDLIKKGEDGGPIANTILNLKNRVDDLNPNHYDLNNPGSFFSRIIQKLPFVGNKMQRYFDKYRTSESVISEIIDSLDEGSRKLQNDNIILSQDKQTMLKDMEELRETVKLGMVLKQKLEYKLERDFKGDEEKSKFIADELIFPLVQRINDLQQTLVVTMQGIAAMEMIIRNNRELIRGVERAKSTTVHALRIAITVALSLGKQKLVLDCINELNATTNSLIAETAKNLRIQGGEIQKQAVNTTLDINVLQQAWDDTIGAINDYDEFRRSALPQMKDNMDKMARLTEVGAKAIEKLEKGSSGKSELLANLNPKTLR